MSARPLRFAAALLLPPALLLLGSAGFYVIEGWPLFDAFYMAVITLTTVGFGEVRPLSTAGRAFAAALSLSGIFFLFYSATEVIRAVVSGELRAHLGRQRMERNLGRSKDHVVICGFGRMGRLVAHRFSELGIPFVVIERQSEALQDFEMPHGIVLHGDATSDDVLLRAGIERARALVSVVASDADNLYITMSARSLCDKLFIVARAEDTPAEKKLVRAGASRVVMPFVIGGHYVAQAVLHTAVLDFIELATRAEHLELQLEETRIAPGSDLAGIALRDARIRERVGALVVALKKASDRMIFNPPPDTVLEPGDVVVALGRREQLDGLEVLAAPVG